jgi:hypothetical protein
MAKGIETVIEPLAQQVLTTIDEHPLVQPLAETHRQLRASQTQLNNELVETRKAIFAAERPYTNIRVTRGKVASAPWCQATARY